MVHDTWQMRLTRIPTRRGSDAHDVREGTRRDDFPPCGFGGPAPDVTATLSVAR